MKTYSTKASDIQKKWYVADAEGKILGRFASGVAQLLRGKGNPMFAPHLDSGDYVIVINADKIIVTGRKLEQKMYYRYTGFPGGLRTKRLDELMETKPEKVLEMAIKGMLPHNRLGRKLITKLKVYTGSVHHHQAQKPEPIDLT